MSEMRPPITAGPIARAFTLLNRRSLSAGAPVEGVTVEVGALSDLLVSGDGLGDPVVFPSSSPAGDARAVGGVRCSSWAKVNPTREIVARAASRNRAVIEEQY